MELFEMTGTNFLRNTKIPAVAFAIVALFVGFALLAFLMILRVELMDPELQYFCAEDQSAFCFANLDQANTISRSPWAFLVSLTLVPVFLAVLVTRLQENLPSYFEVWVVAAMWLAFAFYLAVPITNLYFHLTLSDPITPNAWTLSPPLSQSPSFHELDAILNSLKMNEVAVTILLILNLFGFLIARSARLRSKPLKIARIGFSTLMILVVWMLFSRLNDFLKLVSMDRNFGVVFFDPDLRADQEGLTHFWEHLDSLEIWYVAMALCCLALWFLARRP